MKLQLGDIVLIRQDLARERVEWRIHQIDNSHAILHKVLRKGDGYCAPQPFPMDMLTLAEPIMQFFRYGHLPDHLQDHSRPFAELAALVMKNRPSPERSVALRKLLEAKDAAVRAAIFES